MPLDIRNDDHSAEITAAELKQEILCDMKELGLLP